MPDLGIAAALRRNDVGGMALRRLIVPLVLFPIALGWLRVMGERAGFYDGPFGTAARTMIEMILLVGLAWRTAASISDHAHRAREREELLRTVTAESRVGLVLIDESRRYLFANATYADILGLPDADIVGKQIEDVQGGLFQQMGPGLDQAFAGERGRHELHLQAHPRTGLEHFYEASYEPRLTGTSVSHVAVVMADVTARKRAEIVLKEADVRKDEFLALLAHELRNPLAPLRSGLALMRRKQEHGDQGRFLETQAMMERQLGQLVRLVDDLIDVNRISRGKIDLRRVPVDLATVLDNAVESCQPLIDDLGHHLEVRRPDRALMLDADVTRLGQVFANLLNNAAKYTDRGGHIWVAVEVQGAEVSVWVRDDGVGIPADMLPGIFDPFIQVDTSLERSRAGLGIGLTLVKRLVEMHGGSVTAFSPPLAHHAGNPAESGRGSEFVVRLPMLGQVDVQAAGSHAPAPAIAAPPPLLFSLPPLPAAPPLPDHVVARLRVLIADDNADGADTLTMLLDDMGFETRTAYDGQEALDMAADFLPDVVLLDIGMPKVNGFEVGRTLRGRESAGGAASAGGVAEGVPRGHRRAVLIALTGWGQPDDRRKSSEAGFDHHLVKPVDVRALKGLLSGVEAQARSERAQASSGRAIS